jgi:hypothetical protein
MKFYHILFFLLLFTSLSISSCKKDDPAELSPELSFKSGNGYTSSDVTINFDEQVIIGLIASKNKQTNIKLKNLKLILNSNNNVETLVDTTLNSETISVNYQLPAFSSETSINLLAIVSDDAGRTASVSLNILVTNAKPSLTFKEGTGYTSNDVTVQTNETIVVGYNAKYNEITQEKLKNFKLIVSSNNIPFTILDSTISIEIFSKDFEIKLPSPSTIRLTAIITDDAGRTASVSCNIVAEGGGVKVVKHTEVELGSWNDEIGSFYNAQENTIFNVTEAAANQAKVDLVFYKGDNDDNSIAAPIDASLETILTFDISNWETRNATLFIKTEMTVEDFDAIGEYYEFPEFVEAEANTKIVNMVNGDVLFFKTEAGALGYIKVVALYSRGDLGEFEVIVME